MAIERKFVAQNLKEFRIKEFVSQQLSRVGLSSIKLQRTPLGDKILIRASRPGLVVGRAGSNIQRLTETLKNEFKLENPQIEIEEVQNLGLDANIVAEMIANSLERFGSARFKGVGHRAMEDVMNAGAMGVEILISGKVPSQRAKTWRFYKGYLKKCGDVAISGVNIAYKTAVLKTGVIGIKVSIMPPTTKLPDHILIKEPDKATVEEVVEPETKEEMEKVAAGAEQPANEQKPEAEKRPRRPRARKPKGTEEKKEAEEKTNEKMDEKKEERAGTQEELPGEKGETPVSDEQSQQD
jgi:small subunit ribosomal protein S3